MVINFAIAQESTTMKQSDDNAIPLRHIDIAQGDLLAPIVKAPIIIDNTGKPLASDTAGHRRINTHDDDWQNK
jgi:hypothetical protein